jgi:hypothetical protein
MCWHLPDLLYRALYGPSPCSVDDDYLPRYYQAKDSLCNMDPGSSSYGPAYRHRIARLLFITPD